MSYKDTPGYWRNCHDLAEATNTALRAELTAMTQERDEYRAALIEICACPTWAVGTLIADKYKRILDRHSKEDEIEQARRMV